MKSKYRILTIFTACLVLTPLLALAGQPEYPKYFLDLGIPQLPGSKVVEVRYEGKVPIAVVLESEDTNMVKAVEYYWDQLKAFGGGVWDYYRKTIDKDYLYEDGFLEWSDDRHDHLFDNLTTRKYLLISISRKGSRGSRVELTYPLVQDQDPDWFLKLLKEGVNPKQPDKK